MRDELLRLEADNDGLGPERFDRFELKTTNNRAKPNADDAHWRGWSHLDALLSAAIRTDQRVGHDQHQEYESERESNRLPHPQSSLTHGVGARKPALGERPSVFWPPRRALVRESCSSGARCRDSWLS